MEARTYIDERGRLVLPPSIKKHFNYKAGDKVVLRTNENELHVINLNDALREVQAAFKINEDDKKNMLSDFIASKRLEAKLENQRYNITEDDNSDTNTKRSSTDEDHNSTNDGYNDEGIIDNIVKDDIGNNDDKDNNGSSNK